MLWFGDDKKEMLRKMVKGGKVYAEMFCIRDGIVFELKKKSFWVMWLSLLIAVCYCFESKFIVSAHVSD